MITTAFTAETILNLLTTVLVCPCRHVLVTVTPK